MNRFQSIFIIMILSITILFSAANVRAEVPYQIKTIQAFLYYPETAKFDSRDLISNRLNLWNTIIGEGDAGSPTSITLVLVQLSGSKFSFSAKIKGFVELIATIDGKSVSKQTFDLVNAFSEKPTVTIPFLIYGTGCGKLNLKATIDTPYGPKNSKTVTINFECGE